MDGTPIIVILSTGLSNSLSKAAELTMNKFARYAARSSTREVKRKMVALMTRKYLAFELETAKVQPPDDPKWKEDRPLAIACAATLCCDSDDRLLCGLISSGAA